MHDVVSRGKIQTSAPGFERDQEQIPFPILKGIDRHLALCGGGRTVQVLVMDACLVERLADDR